MARQCSMSHKGMPQLRDQPDYTGTRSIICTAMVDSLGDGVCTWYTFWGTNLTMGLNTVYYTRPALPGIVLNPERFASTPTTKGDSEVVLVSVHCFPCWWWYLGNALEVSLLSNLHKGEKLGVICLQMVLV